MQKSYSDVYQLIAGIRFQNTLRVNSHIFLYRPLRVHMSFTFPYQVLPQTVQTTHLFFPQLTPPQPDRRIGFEHSQTSSLTSLKFYVV